MPSPARSSEARDLLGSLWVTLPLPVQLFALTLAGWLARREADAIAYLREENRVLREHLERALDGRRLRLSGEERVRLAERARPLGLGRLRDLAGLARPETILRWYRELVARKYDGSAKRSSPKTEPAAPPGRPPTGAELEALVVRLARENPTFGYTRIVQTLRTLGHELGRTTVAAIFLSGGGSDGRLSVVGPSGRRHGAHAATEVWRRGPFGGRVGGQGPIERARGGLAVGVARGVTPKPTSRPPR